MVTMFRCESCPAARASRKKSGVGFGVAVDLRADDFDGHRALEQRIERAVDNAHASLAERIQQLVAPDCLHLWHSATLAAPRSTPAERQRMITRGSGAEQHSPRVICGGTAGEYGDGPGAPDKSTARYGAGAASLTQTPKKAGVATGAIRIGGSEAPGRADCQQRGGVRPVTGHDDLPLF